MRVSKGMVMELDSFLENGRWSKEEYQGLLVSGDPSQGGYNMAIQISEDEVLVVDQAEDFEVKEKVFYWSSQIENIRRQYGYQPQADNYYKLT